MILFFSIALTIYVILFFVSVFLFRKKNGAVFRKKSARGKHVTDLFYPMSVVTCSIVKQINKNKDHRESDKLYRNLFIGQNAKQVKEERMIKNITISLIILFLVFVFSLAVSIKEQGEKNLNNGQIIRPAYGESSLNLDLGWLIKDQEKNTAEEGSLSMEIEPQRLKDWQKIQQLFKEGEAYIDQHVFQEDDKEQSVTRDLNFFDKIPALNLTVEWELSDTNWLYADGSLKSKDLPQEGVPVDITAKLMYYDDTCYYTFSVCLMPKEITPMEQFQTELTEYLNTAGKDNSEAVVTLPEQIAGKEIEWEEKTTPQGVILFVLGILIILLLFFRDKNELEKQAKVREKELAFGYSNLIAKFLLLLGAGTTMKGAFERIAADFEKNNNTDGYLYKEMKVTRNELMLGVSEMKAYEAFGRRCGQISYLRFGTILVQNLSRGAKGTLPILELEAKEAFEERKELAKRLGEESSTKLLFPMMGMLGIVLVIVMVPAFWTF